jgi:3-oxoacid CoA-transferase subunit A
MLEKVLITGDTHSQVAQRLFYIKQNMPEYDPEKTAVIVLGDLGLNYYLDKKDYLHKKEASAYGYTIYAVRGNHEARPSEKLGMRLQYDTFVNGAVWVEDEFPLIRYFADWGIYNILGNRTLVIGGAYSVDKYYRLEQNWAWFENEQLTKWEMDACYRNAIEYPYFDLVLTHTCPRSVQPTDLFLGCIDQSKVDSAMEIWMDTLKENLTYDLWLWGHYHGDRIERPRMEMFYYEVEDLNTIKSRWEQYGKTGELDWWLPKSPNFYMEVKNEDEKI